MFFCGNDAESLNEEKTRSLNATFREERRQNSRLSAGSQLHPLMHCSFDASKFGHQKLVEAFRMNLQAALDYEVASLYLLVFGVKPDCAKCAFTDIAMVILQVTNADEPPTLTSCLDENGDSNPKLTESNADMQSICKITVSFDDIQHEVQCKVSENNNDPSRFLASLLEKKERLLGFPLSSVRDGNRPVKIPGWWALYELIKLEGVVLDYESEENVPILFTCFSKEKKFPKSILLHLLDVNDAPKFSRDAYELLIPEGHVTAANVNETELIIGASDEDLNDILTFTLVSNVMDEFDFPIFEMSPSKGLLSVMIDVEFDREMRDFYNLTVMVMETECNSAGTCSHSGRERQRAHHHPPAPDRPATQARGHIRFALHYRNAGTSISGCSFRSRFG